MKNRMLVKITKRAITDFNSVGNEKKNVSVELLALSEAVRQVIKEERKEIVNKNRYTPMKIDVINRLRVHFGKRCDDKLITLIKNNDEVIRFALTDEELLFMHDFFQKDVEQIIARKEANNVK